MTRGRGAALLGGLLGVALAVRAWHATAQNLWLDEVVTARLARAPLTELLQPSDPTLIQPTLWLSPLYYLLLKGWLALAPGADDTALRLLSVLLGTATVAVIAVVMAELAGPAAGLLAGGFAALAPFHVWYSQEVRPYVLLLLLGTLAIGALHRGLDGGGRRPLALFIVAAVLAAYVHPMGVLVPVLAVADSLLEGAWRDRARRRWLLTALCATGVGLLPAALLLLAGGGNFVADPRGAGLADLLYVLYAFAAGFSLGPPTDALRAGAAAALRAAAPVIALVALAFGVPVAVAAWTARGRCRTRLLAWLLVPLLVPLLLALASGNPVNARYAILGFPAFIGLLAIGVWRLGAWRPLPGVAFGGGVLALMLVALWNLHHDPRYAKEDCRAAARLLARHTGPEDLVLVNASYMQAAVRYYYPGPAPVLPMPRAGIAESEAALREELAAAVRDRGDVWLVLTRTFHGDREGRLPALLGERLVAREVTRLPGVTVVRYTPPAAPVTANARPAGRAR